MTTSHDAETTQDPCPLSKASCDPLANGCDGECETEWLSYVCAGGRHGECSGVAWQADVTCECACHKPRIPPAEVTTVTSPRPKCGHSPGHEGTLIDDVYIYDCHITPPAERHGDG